MATPENTLQMTLPSVHESLEDIMEAVEAFAETHGFDEDFAYRLLMVATEGATNAIRHGNEFDETKRFHLKINVDQERVDLWVRDEGHGFDREAVADPLASNNMLEDSGRGLFLIEHMADKVTYESEGRTMHALFHRPSA